MSSAPTEMIQVGALSVRFLVEAADSNGSASIERAEWPESRIARRDLAEEINNLKRESDKDIIAYGGASFAQSLARLGLVDEYRLTIHPVAVADGRPLFKDLSAPVRLRLVESRTFTSAALQVYEPA